METGIGSGFQSLSNGGQRHPDSEASGQPIRDIFECSPLSDRILDPRGILNNEIGNVNRMIELEQKVGSSL